MVLDHDGDGGLVEAHVDGGDPVVGAVEGVAEAVLAPQAVAEIPVEVQERGPGGLGGVGEGRQGAGRRDRPVVPVGPGLVGGVAPGVVAGGEAPRVGAVAPVVARVVPRVGVVDPGDGAGRLGPQHLPRLLHIATHLHNEIVYGRELELVPSTPSPTADHPQFCARAHGLARAAASGVSNAPDLFQHRFIFNSFVLI